MKPKNRRFWRGMTALTATILAFVLEGTSIANAWRAEIDKALGTTSTKVISEESEDGELYTFLSDYEDTEELMAANQDLAERFQEEGSVLLKNEDTLPLAGGEKVTLLGMYSVYSLHGGSMGSHVNAEQNVSLTEALEENGFEVNPTTISVYEQLGAIQTGTVEGFGGEEPVYGYQPMSLSGKFTPDNETNAYSLGEPSTDLYGSYEADYEASFDEYSDAAIVVIGRPSSEAADYYPGEEGISITEVDGEPIDEAGENVLSLTKNEQELIETAKEISDQVIVLVNSNNVLELEELKQDDGVDAVLWIGGVGNYGMNAVADILNGTVSPSGKLPDTYAVDSTSSPAMANFGLISYANQDEISTDSTDYAALRAGWYLVQAEGIYTGYKYYETRYADAAAGAGNADADGWDYTEEVSWSFGYGLSYSEFEQEVNSVDVDLDEQTITANVTVTNTGDVAAKEVVQLYAQTPYTQYDIDNQVEKAAIQLLGYEKTDTLEPGASEEVEVVVDMKYLASYDANGAGTYILDAGDYYFTTGNGAHDALNNVLARQGITAADGVMDYDGDESLVSVWTLDELDTTTFAESDNGTEITNQADDMDLNYYQEGTVTYLSRNDWTGTFPETYEGIAANDEMIVQLRNETYEVATTDDEDEVVFGKDYTDEGEVNLTLADLKGADYDDDGWELLLNQLEAEEVLDWITLGGTSTSELESVSSPFAWQNDGPNGFSSYTLGEHAETENESSPFYMDEDDENIDAGLNVFPNEPVMGATFNKELVYEFGQILGNDSLWSGNTIIWAGSLNLHRTPYNGRNHEYYSEDAMLTNYLGAALVEGGKDYGVLIGLKHFAFNDQETNRVGISNYMTEQRAREGDLRAFQGAVEDAQAYGLMTSFTRFGATYSNAHTGIMQNVLRDEWGFTGLSSTDMLNGASYFRPVETIVNGITMMANTNEAYFEANGEWASVTYDNLKNDATVMQALRDNAHYQLYAIANSNAMNGLDASSQIVSVKPWWEIALIATAVVTGILTVLAAGCYIFIIARRKEHE